MSNAEHLANVMVEAFIAAVESGVDLVPVVADSTSTAKIAPFIKQFPGRLVNVGIAEQSMVGTAAGLALGGKVAVTCNAAPFLISRANEQIKVDVCYNNTNVKLFGLNAGASYGPLASMAGGTPVYVETKAENEFRLTPEELRSAITPRTKVLVLPFPNNPTGGIMGREDLEAIAQVLRGTDIMVISDEIYAELTYGQHHVSIANIPDMYERTIVVNGFSKSHAMTGWRMGYLCGPAPLIKQMLKLHQFGIMSAPTTSQYAAIEAMRNGDRDIEKMRDEYDGRRRYLVEGLRRIGLPCFEPKGAFYVFPDIRGTGLSSEDFCERFLMEEKVAVIAGNAFGAGGEGFVRCCYATSMKDIAEALTRMDNFLTNLKKKQARERGE